MTILIILCLLVGFICGVASAGGVLLIPAIQYCLGIDIHVAAGTALCSFLFTGTFGTFLHWRAGNLHRDLVIPTCIGGIIFGILGAITNYWAGSLTVTVTLAWIIIFSGVAALRPIKSLVDSSSFANKKYLLFAVGSFVGFMAGLTGVGGPVLSVPIMIALGFNPFTSVAAALPLQMVGCFSGTVGNAIFDQIDWTLAAITVVFQIVGFYVGMRSAKHINVRALTIFVAFLCVGTGIFMLVRA